MSWHNQPGAPGPQPGGPQGPYGAPPRGGNTGPQGPHHFAGPRPPVRPPRRSFFDSLRASGWYRATPRVFGGVCSGVSARTGWDLSLVRVATVLITFFVPMVTIVYGLAWLFLPEAADGRIHVEETKNGRFDIAILGGVFFIFLGLTSFIPSAGIFGIFGAGWSILWFAVISIVVFLAVKAAQPPVTPMTPQTPPVAPGNPHGAPHPQGAPQPMGGGQGGPAQSGPAPSPFPPATGPQGGTFYGGAPQGAPQPRPWVPPVPVSAPRTVSRAFNMVTTGLVLLALAATFMGWYYVGNHTYSEMTWDDSGARLVAQIGVAGGGACLLIVGIALAIAALRDRGAAWLTALSVIGMLMAVPTGFIGLSATRDAFTSASTAIQNPSTDTHLDWQVDRVTGISPTGNTTLDLTGAPVGTSKTITVSWQAWQDLTIDLTQGQPVQISCEGEIDNLSTAMVNGSSNWAAPLNGCDGSSHGRVLVQSPTWGQEGLGGIRILIDSQADLSQLTITEQIDTQGRWSTAASTPSATPSSPATPSSSSDPQSGN